MPRATYRLQLQPGFGFDEVAALADYLQDLGVSHVYLSPCLEAAPGSLHGYDVVDPSRASSALGGDDAYDRMCEALRARGLGQVLDIVPNHMSTCTPQNRWWWDVLAQGRASPHACFFDIDWEVDDPALAGKIVLPILGDELSQVLHAGDIRLARQGRALVVQVYDRVLPLNRETANDLRAEANDGGPEAGSDPERTLDTLLTTINADPWRLSAILERQHYRLMFWRSGQERLNYRRFFDIDTLVALAVEREEVFEAVHTHVLEWVRRGDVQGLRVDHPDGLWDPLAYLERLRRAAPDAWVVVEKILEPDETLPAWPVAGTTGYDFIEVLGGLFVDAAHEPTFSEIYTRFTARPAHVFDALVRAKKRTIAHRLFAAEVGRLTRLFAARLTTGRDAARGAPRDAAQEARHLAPSNDVLRDVLIEVAACMPVYRTYLRPGDPVHPRDRALVDQAVAEASATRPELDPELFRALGRILRGEARDAQAWQLVMRFQQLTGPVMAKGLEDTAFYDYHRLIALNEVGGNPGRFGVEPEAFHDHCARIARNHPETMVATSTHDTKRSGDVRARLSVLSELPERWEQAVSRWSALAEPYRQGGYPDRAFEYHLYQTLVGAWPLSIERALTYLDKAAKEAKRYTSWREPNPAYEQAVDTFVTRLLDDPAFVADMDAFVEPLRVPARITSLAQTLLELTAPGVPDIYQGHELWAHQLTDPDNRRPPDVARLRGALAALDGLDARAVWARQAEGLPKLFVTKKALEVRRRHADVFGEHGDYTPLQPQGDKAHHAVAFLRGRRIVTVVPRLVVGLGDTWCDTSLPLPPGSWHNAFTGERWEAGELKLETLLAHFPVALLERE